MVVSSLPVGSLICQHHQQIDKSFDNATYLEFLSYRASLLFVKLLFVKLLFVKLLFVKLLFVKLQLQCVAQIMYQRKL